VRDGRYGGGRGGRRAVDWRGMRRTRAPLFWGPLAFLAAWGLAVESPPAFRDAVSGLLRSTVGWLLLILVPVVMLWVTWLALVFAHVWRDLRLARCQRERVARGLCPRCGYDLTGNVSGRCPECGTRVGGSSGIPRQGR